MTMHFADGVNNLTNTALDPLSKMPELKHCAVSVEKIRRRSKMEQKAICSMHGPKTRKFRRRVSVEEQ